MSLLGFESLYFRTTERVTMSRQKKNKPLKTKRRVADNRVGQFVDVDHPGDNRRARRLRGINNNPAAQKRAAKRAEIAAAEAEAQAALDKAEES